MSNALPSRAAAALRPAFPVRLSGGGALALGPFTPRRLVMLHDVAAPLFADGDRYGLAFGWCATVRILAEPDSAALEREIALDSPAEFVASSVDWFAEHPAGLCVEDLAEAAAAIKAEWSRICDLDRQTLQRKGRPRWGKHAGR